MSITMRQLLEAGVHFGHQTRYWSPSMAPYIYGDRNKIHIINLEKTLPLLKEAMNYLGSIAAHGGKVLFVGTKRQAGKQVREQALLCGSPYVDYRWLGGMLTNYKTVKNSIDRLKELETRIQSGATARLSKKEALALDRERVKLDRTLSGIKNMNGLPEVLFVIDIEHEKIAVSEANKLGIPVVAVVDTNCSPKGVDYVIPGNDDSGRAIKLYLEVASTTINESRAAVLSTEIPLGEDEYVEVDETGEIIEPSASPAANTDDKAAPRKIVRKKVVKPPVTDIVNVDNVMTEHNYVAGESYRIPDITSRIFGDDCDQERDGKIVRRHIRAISNGPQLVQKADVYDARAAAAMHVAIERRMQSPGASQQPAEEIKHDVPEQHTEGEENAGSLNDKEAAGQTDNNSQSQDGES